MNNEVEVSLLWKGLSLLVKLGVLEIIVLGDSQLLSTS